MKRIDKLVSKISEKKHPVMSILFWNFNFDGRYKIVSRIDYMKEEEALQSYEKYLKKGVEYAHWIELIWSGSGDTIKADYVD